MNSKPPNDEIERIDLLEVQLRALLPAIDNVRAVLRQHDDDPDLDAVVGETARWINRCSPGQLIAALLHLRAELESPQ